LKAAWISGQHCPTESIALEFQPRENNKTPHADPHQTPRNAMTVRKRDAQRHSYADYLLWSATYGDELINGTAYVREPPSPSFSHQVIVGELYRQLANALKGKPCRVCVAPLDIRLPRSTEPDDQVDTVVQPDVFIVCDLQKIDARGVRGAPDWLAEVLSPSTARHDQVRKIPVYERAGVREVWLINPIKQTLTLYRLAEGHYGRATTLELEGRTPLMAVPGVSIDWGEVLAAI
jgi:Uma2 family endonuclease